MFSQRLRFILATRLCYNITESIYYEILISHDRDCED